MINFMVNQHLRKEQFLNEEIDYFFNQANSLGITGNELLTMYEDYLRRNS